MNLRRIFPILVGSALFSAALMPPQVTAQATTSPAIRNIVFVHGAWADGSSWSKVIPLLESKGFHVVSVQNPLTSFADDVAATKRIIDSQDGPVLLVGHSYGGAVITEAGNNSKVAGLVYVAAFAPDQGESPASMGKPYGPTPGVGEGVFEDFAPDLSIEERKALLATQGPTQGAALGSQISAAAWHDKPTWFVIASNDRMISPQQEKDSAVKMKAKTLTLPTSHVPMLSRPKEVADFISDAASGSAR